MCASTIILFSSLCLQLVFQVSTLLGLAPIGISRYTNGKSISLQFNKSTNFFYVPSLHPYTSKATFIEIDLSLDANSKLLMMIFIVITFLKETSHMKMVSSTYCNRFIFTSFFPTLKLEKRLCLIASFIKPLRPSVTTVKRKG